MEIILASSSPRRKEILKNLGYDFKVIPSNYDENILNLDYSKELVENCAYKKALDVMNNNNFDDDFIIIGADTVVVAENKILGKPKSFNEAIIMLQKLSGKTHFVQTSICIMNKKLVRTASDITYVTFKNISLDEIKNYINLENPLDKAGSYGIQDKNFTFVESIEGNFDNVVGFSSELFKKLLIDFI